MKSNLYVKIKKSVAAITLFVITATSILAASPSNDLKMEFNAGRSGSKVASTEAKTETGIYFMLVGNDLATAEFHLLLAAMGKISREQAYEKVAFVAEDLEGTEAEARLNYEMKRGNVESVINALYQIEQLLKQNLSGEASWGFRTGVAVKRILIGSNGRMIKYMKRELDEIPILVRQGTDYASAQELSQLKAIAQFAGKQSLSEAEFD